MKGPNSTPGTTETRADRERASHAEAVEGMHILRRAGLNNEKTNPWFRELGKNLDDGMKKTTRKNIIHTFLHSVLQVPTEYVAELGERIIQADTDNARAQKEHVIHGDENDLLDGEVRIGNTLFIRKLGKGGAGTTYLAFDMDAKEIVAAKVSNKPIEKEKPAEVAAWNNAEHVTRLVFPSFNTKHVFKRKFSGEHYSYVEMTYFKGMTMQELIEKNQLSLTQDEYLALFTLITHFLAKYIHAKGVTHCDMKPGNILILVNGGVGVADYDAARFPGMDDSLLQDKIPATPAYASPEQSIKWSNADQRSDIYSTAVTMVHAITGKRLFEKQNFGAVQYMMAHQTAPIDEHTRKVLEQRLGTEGAKILLKCLEKNPDNRFQTTMELGEALWKAAHPKGSTKYPTFADVVKDKQDPTFVAFADIVRENMRQKPGTTGDTVRNSANPVETAKDGTHGIPAQTISSTRNDVQEIVGLS